MVLYEITTLEKKSNINEKVTKFQRIRVHPVCTKTVLYTYILLPQCALYFVYLIQNV